MSSRYSERENANLTNTCKLFGAVFEGDCLGSAQIGAP